MQDIDGHTHNDCTKAKLCNAENCEAVDFFWCATEVHPDTRKMTLWGRCNSTKCEGTDGTQNEMAIREEYLKKEDFQWCATEVDSEENMKNWEKCSASKTCASSNSRGISHDTKGSNSGDIIHDDTAFCHLALSISLTIILQGGHLAYFEF